MTSATYRLDGQVFHAEATRQDRPWGNGIAITILDHTGVLWARTSYTCHPEFLDFERYQAMSTAELLGAAISRLIDGDHRRLEEYRRTTDLHILFRFNGHGQGMACAYPKSS